MLTMHMLIFRARSYEGRTEHLVVRWFAPKRQKDVMSIMVVMKAAKMTAVYAAVVDTIWAPWKRQP